jgi:hypothetical protein
VIGNQAYNCTWQGDQTDTSDATRFSTHSTKYPWVESHTSRTSSSQKKWGLQVRMHIVSLRSVASEASISTLYGPWSTYNPPVQVLLLILPGNNDLFRLDILGGDLLFNSYRAPPFRETALCRRRDLLLSQTSTVGTEIARALNRRNLSFDSTQTHQRKSSAPVISERDLVKIPTAVRKWKPSIWKN